MLLSLCIPLYILIIYSATASRSCREEKPSAVVGYIHSTINHRGNMKQEQFDKLMETYQKTHESSLLTYARDLYMVVTFLGVAYLVFTVLI